MAYIALGHDDEPGKYIAVLRDDDGGRVRIIESKEQLEVLKQDWRVNEVRGDALLDIQSES